MIPGSMVALVTPMDAQGHLDWDSLTRLVDFHLQEGTNAIVAVGTTGESATLDVSEHVAVIPSHGQAVWRAASRSSPVPAPTRPARPSS